MRLCKLLVTTAATVVGVAVLGITPAQAAVRYIPASIPDDCSVGATAQIQDWIDESADGDTLYFTAGACYWVGQLEVTDRHNLTFRGQGAVFSNPVVPPASPKTSKSMWLIVGGSGINLYNMQLQGSNPNAVYNAPREWHRGINVEGTSDVEIKNVHGSNIWGDFVQVRPDQRSQTDSSGTGAVIPDGVLVQNSSADIIGRHAVTCSGCTNLTFDNNDFSNIGYHVFDLEVEGSAWHARNIDFTNNTVSGSLRHSIVANAGLGTDITDVTISGNTDTATHQTCSAPFWVLDTEPTKDNWTFTGNSIRNLGVGFSLEGVSNIRVENNTVNNLYGGCVNQESATYMANVPSGYVRFNNFLTATRIFQAGHSTPGLVKCGNTLNGVPNKPTAC